MPIHVRLVFFTGNLSSREYFARNCDSLNAFSAQAGHTNINIDIAVPGTLLH